MCPARLFIIGDSTPMGAYALAILPLLHFMLDLISVNKLNAK